VNLGVILGKVEWKILNNFQKSGKQEKKVSNWMSLHRTTVGYNCYKWVTVMDSVTFFYKCQQISKLIYLDTWPTEGAAD